MRDASQYIKRCLEAFAKSKTLDQPYYLIGGFDF